MGDNSISKGLADSSKVSASYWVHAAITVAIMVFVRFIPPLGDMTVFGMTVLGIFLGALYGWLKCGMLWPSVLALIMLAFTDYSPNVVSVFGEMFKQNAWQTTLFLLIFTSLLTSSGITNELANRMVSSKICKGHPWVLTVILFLAAAMIASFGAHLAALIIGWGFIYSICKQTGYTRHDKWTKMMIVGMVLAISVGSSAMPFMTGTVSTFGYLAGASGGEFATYNYAAYLGYSLPVVAISTALYFLFCKFIIRPDLSKLTDGLHVADKTPFSARQKIALGALIAIFVLSIGPSLLPPGAIKAFFNTIGSAPIPLAIVIVVCLLRDKNGEAYYSFQDIAASGVSWSMIFMVGAAIVLGSALSIESTGFSTSMVNLLTPIFEGQGALIFGIFVIVATIVLTQIINNVVVGAFMVPLMYTFVLQVGGSPMALTAAICMSVNIAILFPCGSATAALIWGNSEWVGAKQIFGYGAIALLASIAALIVCLPLGNMLFPV